MFSFSSGDSATVRLSSTRSGTFEDKGRGSGLAREEGTSVVLSWSSGAARPDAVDAEPS